ncbi:YiiQ family protein [Pantoea sp. BAV 3049]|uniref:YiiQ family protein n=1 Tax=Pantoea sp. BAV 3049 TaxID=2654188 RepID=UPI00131DE164|nr:YiiQ family protein [Pantoea sp. BAV 3049]
MNKAIFTGIMLLVTLATAPAQADAGPQDRAEHMPTAPYLLAGAPTFDMTIGQFREKYNASNPTLTIPEYRAIDNRGDKSNLTRAASKINENLYASTALEQGTGKIRTLQITWLPVPGPEEESARDKARAYMAALERFFEPTLNEEQSLKRLDELLSKGKGSRYFAQTEGAVRYVIADNGDKGLTFAIEPIKLAMNTPDPGQK